LALTCSVAALSIILGPGAQTPTAHKYPQEIDGTREFVRKFRAWLIEHTDRETGLPFSYVGEAQLANKTFTYDAAVTAMAWLTLEETGRAQRVLDFYIHNPSVWRFGGIIEAVNTTTGAGEDWSVRTGSNLWMGIAAVHVYRATKARADLALAQRLAALALALQDRDQTSPTFGGIRLGPPGDRAVSLGDQRFNYDPRAPSFYEVFATEHNLDAYALFNLLCRERINGDYRQAREDIVRWLRNVAYNKEQHRLNRGFFRGIDNTLAVDVHSWAISALGVVLLDSFERSFATKLVDIIETCCLTTARFLRSDGSTAEVRGVDFIDRNTAMRIGRQPLVSPEWTFQFVNAYRRIQIDCVRPGDDGCAALWRHKKESLLLSILGLAGPTPFGFGLPYATRGQELIGHENRTPVAGSLSTVAVAYGLLAISGFDPLICIPDRS
jgi:hypothetical protein